jgi:hypothetical protein
VVKRYENAQRREKATQTGIQNKHINSVSIKIYTQDEAGKLSQLVNKYRLAIPPAAIIIILRYLLVN